MRAVYLFLVLGAVCSTAAAQALYFTDYFQKTIRRATLDGQVSVFSSDPLIEGNGNLAFGPNGQLYSTCNSGKIIEFDGNGNATVVATGFQHLQGLTFDPSGNIYVTDAASSALGQSSIKKISTTGQITTMDSGLDLLGGITYGPDGNLYVGTKQEPGQIFRVSLGGTLNVFASMALGTSCDDLRFGQDGYLFVADSDGTRIERVAPDGTPSQFTFSGNVTGIDFAPDGYLYNTNATFGYIRRTDPSGTTTTWLSGLSRPWSIRLGAVPEPCSMLALVLGIATLARRRRVNR